MKRTYLALYCNGEFVDANLLHKDISIAYFPSLYEVGTTISEIEKIGRTFRNTNGDCYIPESYFLNLSQCELKEVQVTFPK